MNTLTLLLEQLYSDLQQISTDEIILAVITVGCIGWLIYLIIDDGMTCCRISRSVDDIIACTDQSEDEKSTNLWWICGNCSMFARRSLLFKRGYNDIITKATGYMMCPEGTHTIRMIQCKKR